MRCAQRCRAREIRFLHLITWREPTRRPTTRMTRNTQSILPPLQINRHAQHILPLSSQINLHRIRNRECSARNHKTGTPAKC